jgi:riboflavin kinase/FMN adenylyltransferase
MLNCDSPAAPPAVVTIGTFDGVHRGHQHLLRRMVARARRLGVRACAVTFDPHPRQVVQPGVNVPLLTSTPEKVRRLRATGLDEVWVCRFTPELARLEPAAFLALVAGRWSIRELWVGHDFALGRSRAGNHDVLRQIGRRHAWQVQVVAPLRLGGEIVSSSRVRRLLEAGRVEEASVLLGWANQRACAATRAHGLAAGRPRRGVTIRN